MLSLLRKLHNQIPVTPEINKSYQAHIGVLLNSRAQVYYGQRTHLALIHKMFMGLGMHAKSSLKYNYGKFKLNDDGTIKRAADNIKYGLHFSEDGGIMKGTFYPWGGLKNGVFFHPESGVVEEGLFINEKFTKGIRLCKNGNFEEGVFENGQLVNGLCIDRINSIIEEGAFKDGVLVNGVRYMNTGKSVKVMDSLAGHQLEQLLEVDDELNDRVLAEYSEGECDNDDDDDDVDDYLSE